MEPTGRVQDHDVEAFLARGFEAEPRRSDGILAVERVDRDLDLLAELLELVDRCGSLEVARDERGPLAVLPKEQGELCGRGRLARALQAREEDHRRRTSEREARVTRAHERGELLVDDLHDLLARRQALEDVLPERALLHRRGEVAGDLEVHVRLEERQANLAHRLGDGLLVEASAATEAAERGLKLVGERVEHGPTVYAEPSRS